MAAGISGKDGFTLIGVLVFCLILIPVCASLAQSSRSFARGVRGDVDAFKRELLATGIADAVAARVGSNRSLFDRLNEGPLVCTLADHEVAISMRDHDGKIDLNNAASELLIAGFEAAGIDKATAGLFQQFVEASRSNGEVPRDISTLVAKVSLKHTSFEHVDELQDVLVALDIPAIDMAAFFTINRGVANVEATTAAPELRERLRTLGNQGVVFESNSNLDYIDVIVHLRSTKRDASSALSRTFRKISPLGDMIEIQTERLPGRLFPSEPSRSNCVQSLGLQGGA
jgi:hypothetical protein